MATGWQAVGGAWYHFDSNGAMATGWRQVGGTWYWLESSGAMATGWRFIGGAWYFFDASGAMKTGWFHDGVAWYYTDSNGAMVANREVDGVPLRADGSFLRYRWSDSVAENFPLFMRVSGTVRWSYVGPGGDRLKEPIAYLDADSDTFRMRCYVDTAEGHYWEKYVTSDTVVLRNWPEPAFGSYFAHDGERVTIEYATTQDWTFLEPGFIWILSPRVVG
jgi:hypothetical protein